MGHLPWSCWPVDGGLVASNGPSCVPGASGRRKAAVVAASGCAVSVASLVSSSRHVILNLGSVS